MSAAQVKSILALVLVSSLLSGFAAASGQLEAQPPHADELIEDENKELSQHQLGDIIKNFGQHIKQVMDSEMGELMNEMRNEEGASGRLNKRELEKFNQAHQTLSENTKARIELAGQKNDGQLTQSAYGTELSKSFFSKVSAQLQSAGSFIANQMSALSGLAPKIKGKVRALPAKLRKLMHWPRFLTFKIKFNKIYKSPREELYHEIIYLKNQAVVGIHNLKYVFGRVRYLLSPTQFADLTGHEYQQIYDNKEAETGQNLPDNATDLDKQSREKLNKLAEKKLNVFGQSMEEIIEKTRLQDERRRKLAEAEEARQVRRKRSTIEQSYSYNELDDEEDEEMEEPQEEEQLDGDGDSAMEEADFLLVDNYADELNGDADLEHLDEIEAIMDEALAEQTRPERDFEPIDLRQTGCVIQPENQDKCGCCYAHVTAAAASYYNCMQARAPKPTRFNARFTSDCGRYLTAEGERVLMNGCSGGKMSQAVRFTAIAGTHAFMDYECARVSYDFKSDKCAFPRPSSIENWADIQVPFFKHSQFTNLKMNEVDLHLRTVGPVFVNLRSWKNFKLQGNGIYGKFEESDNPTIHSMLIVGHDKDAQGRDYWIIWNSHGIAWGEQGFVRVYTKSLDFFKVYLGGFLTVELQDAKETQL